MGRILQLGGQRWVPNVAAMAGGFYDDFSGATPSPLWTTLLGTLATNSGALRATALAADTYEIMAALNPGFETAGLGGLDVFGSWGEAWGDGGIEQTLVAGEFRSGVAAAKLTGGASNNTTIVNYSTALPGATYRYAMWCRGDGVNEGQWRLYDSTGGAAIKATATTGVPGIVYTEAPYTFAAPTGCLLVQILLKAPAAAGGIAYFDDISTQLALSALVYNNNSPNAIVTASMISPAALVTPRAIVLRCQDALNYVCLRLAPNTAGTDTILETVTAGVRATVASADVDWTAGGTDKVRVTVQGNNYTVEHMKSGAPTWTTAFTTTTASFNTLTNFGLQVFAATDNSFDDILIQPA